MWAEANRRPTVEGGFHAPSGNRELGVISVGVNSFSSLVTPFRERIASKVVPYLPEQLDWLSG
jgi:hypothetical protein